MLEFTVDKDFEKLTLGRFLRVYCGVSARTLAKLKACDGAILLNGVSAKAKASVKLGDSIKLSLPQSVSEGVAAVNLPIDVVYEDAYLIVLNKPAFMPVHPTKVHQTDTLANALAFYAQKMGEEYAFRAVNRLDRNTSGLVLIAKDRHTAFRLSSCDINKNYIALVHGNIDEKGTVNMPIALAPDSKILRKVSLSGKPAVTHYSPLKCFDDYTLLKLTLETGRTHQIRCHMSYIGHPLLGDDMYGGFLDKINRQALHCKEMSFVHPITETDLKLSCDLPEDMKNLI